MTRHHDHMTPPGHPGISLGPSSESTSPPMPAPEKKSFVSRQEAIFFVLLFFGFPILSAIQYESDYGTRETFYNTFIYFGISSIFTIVPYFFYYRVIIPRFLFTKKVLPFLGVLLLFLLAFDLYLRFVIDGFIAHARFLPVAVQKTAGGEPHGLRKWIRQGVSFTLLNLLCVTALAYFNRTLQKERQLALKERQLAQMERQQLQWELHALKAQLHPHFFFNTLNNIYSLALKGSETAAPTIRKLGEMMRYVVDEAPNTRVSLEQEIHFIGHYIELEKIRHDENIRITWEVQGSTLNLALEPLLLLPLVENAFKHGIGEETAEGFVEIVLLSVDRDLTLQITNSKPLLHPPSDHLPTPPGRHTSFSSSPPAPIPFSSPRTASSASPPRQGIGLVNLQKRLSLLYPGKHRFQITESPRTYTAYLHLSLKEW